MTKIHQRQTAEYNEADSNSLRETNKQERVPQGIRATHQHGEAQPCQKVARRQEKVVSSTCADPPQECHHPKRRNVESTPEKSLCSKRRWSPHDERRFENGKIS